MSAELTVIENPLSGERIVIDGEPQRKGDDVLAWDLFLSPGGRVPNSHLHPRQEERFSVVAGQVLFRLRRRKILAGPGEVVVVPPGKVHHFSNAGRRMAWVHVETRPVLEMVAMFETAAAMARRQVAERRAIPHLVDLALFMREFEAEVAAPYLPRFVRLVVRPVAWLAHLAGKDARYGRMQKDRQLERATAAT